MIHRAENIKSLPRNCPRVHCHDWQFAWIRHFKLWQNAFWQLCWWLLNWLSDKITIPQIHGMPGNITHRILYKLVVRNVKKQTSLRQDRDFMPTSHSVLEHFVILKVFAILLYLHVLSIFRDMLRWNYTHARCDDTGCYFSLVPPQKSYSMENLG